MQAPCLAEQCRAVRPIKFDTAAVPPLRRISFWEEKCADRVVGLRCTSLSQPGSEHNFSMSSLARPN